MGSFNFDSEKMPCRATMKLMTRNGGMFECGWLPPAAVMLAGFIATFAAALEYIGSEQPAEKFPTGLWRLPVPELQASACVCAGISALVSV